MNRHSEQRPGRVALKTNRSIRRALIDLFMVLSLALASLGAQAQAAQHALLIGVSDYSDPRIPDLEGPVNDVAALQQVLMDHWQFSSEQITTLTNAAASESAILDALDDLYVRSRPGDNIIIYYSGHGTSASDPDLGGRLNLPDGTGAIVGSDFDPSRLKLSALDRPRDDGLIIGRIDLRPRLQALDEERDVLVIFDACFSGNAARELPSPYKPSARRQIDLRDTMRTLLSQAGRQQTRSWRSVGADGNNRAINEAYPYSNTVYFGAAAENQFAVDLSQADIDAGRVSTFDGKPHGGFTDALLRALVPSSTDPSQTTPDDGVAATNTDLSYSFGLLFNRTRSRFDAHCQMCGHTPVSLPAANSEVLSRVILSRSSIPVHDAAATVLVSTDTLDDANNALTVVAELGDAVKQDMKRAMPELALLSELSPSAEQVDIRFMDTPDALKAVAADGSVIAEFDKPMSSSMLERWLRARQWLQRRLQIDRMADAGQLRGEFKHALASNRVLNGDDVVFTVTSDIKARLAVFVMDSRGALSLLYPYSDAEREATLAAGIPVQLPAAGEAPIRVTPPFGTDTVLIYALPIDHDLNTSLAAMAASASIALTDPHLATFESALTKEALAYSAQHIRLISSAEL